MTDRTATDTLKGYFYQFDLAILSVLRLKDTDHEITVEGIEDIDINKLDEELAVQCKYHAKTEYNHSVIAKPIRLMLNHFKEVLLGKRRKVKYLYYGHFKNGHSKLKLPLSLQDFKSHFLTYEKKEVEHKHHEELNLTDYQLQEFMKLLEININAQEYNEQLTEIYRLIKVEVDNKCDDFEAESFYYNNALKVITNLAKEENITKRRISKGDFIAKIDSKQILFHKWYVQFKGKRQILAGLRSKYFSDFNSSPFERFFLIEVGSKDYSLSEIKSLVHLISRKYSQLSKRSPDPFCPYIFIYGISSIQLIDLKSALFSEGFKFRDGFDYNGAVFSPDSLMEPATFHNQIRLKFVNHLTHLEELLKRISKTKEVYQFYLNQPYFSTTVNNVKQLTLQVEDFKDVNSIL